MLEMLTKKRNKKRKGFTLVELIVVIAILGILMLIAVPRFAGFREQSAIKADEATGATIGKAAELYALNNNIVNTDEVDEVTVEKLEDEDLIDENTKLQSKTYGGEDTVPTIKVKNGQATVTVNGLKLYPNPDPNPEGNDS